MSKTTRSILLALAVLLAAAKTADAAPALSVSCPPHLTRNRAADTNAVRLATAALDAAHSASLAGLGEAGVGQDRFLTAQRRYYAERLQILLPLARQGNAAAIFSIAKQYHSADSGIADDSEWRRLMHCAATLGEPAALIERMIEAWHDKGDGSFATIQRNRAEAMDIVERLADQGDLGGITYLATYIGAGRHQYPVDADLGRRLFTLCAEGGAVACRSRLIDAPVASEAYALQDPLAFYGLLEAAANAEPVRYDARRKAAWDGLSTEQRVDAADATASWAVKSWPSLKPRWTALRAEIVAKGCPQSVDCRFGHLCTCP